MPQIITRDARNPNFVSLPGLKESLIHDTPPPETEADFKRLSADQTD